jgi:hypothetical protein
MSPLGCGLVIDKGCHHDDDLVSNPSEHRALEIMTLTKFDAITHAAFIHKSGIKKDQWTLVHAIVFSGEVKGMHAHDTKVTSETNHPEERQIQ